MRITNFIQERLITLRKEHGLGTRALAERMGIGQSRVSYSETGKTRINCEYVDKFCEALGITPTEFLYPDQTWHKQPDIEMFEREVQAATKVDVFCNTIIPLPLQSIDYIKALHQGISNISPDNVVELHIFVERKKHLRDMLLKKELRVVGCEWNFYPIMGSTLVMKDQLEQLLKSKANFRVIPKDIHLTTLPTSNIFLIDDRIVLGETIIADIFSRKKEILDYSRTYFDRLWMNGLGRDENSSIIKKALKHHSLTKE